MPESKDSNRIFWKLVAGISIVVLLAWLANMFLVPVFFPTPQDRGTFGDMFGALNALFSGFALGGVIVAIVLQSKELSLQRQDLRRSADAQEATERALLDQMRSLLLAAQIQSLASQVSANAALLQDAAAKRRPAADTVREIERLKVKLCDLEQRAVELTEIIPKKPDDGETSA